MIRERCLYFCGPHKGYHGKAEYDGDADIFHGEVLGVRDVITFQGCTPQELKEAFKDSVDDYLKFCAERGESPDKPFSGKFIARIPPEVHRKLSVLAEVAGKSLNQYLTESLKEIAEISPIATHGLSSELSTSPRRQKAKPSSPRRSRKKKGQPA